MFCFTHRCSACLERRIFLSSLALLRLSLCSSPISDICSCVSHPSKCSLPCPLRRVHMRVTEEILHIVEVEDRYIRNDITCVGLASARPNYMLCKSFPRNSKAITFWPLKSLRGGHTSEIFFHMHVYRGVWQYSQGGYVLKGVLP